MQPWPTAYTFLKNSGRPPLRIMLLRTESMDGSFGPPGSLRPGGTAIEVAAGAGIVRILELQPAGKKRMPAQAFLNGHALGADDRFGSEA